MAEKETSSVLFEIDGVFIHTSAQTVHDDVFLEGKLAILEKTHGIFIEWIPTDKVDGGAENAQECAENKSLNAAHEWTVVDQVGYTKSTTSQLEDSVAIKSRFSGGVQNKYVINFNINEMKSFKRSERTLGWCYLVFIMKYGTAHPPLHFHKGGTKSFISELQKHLIIQRSKSDHSLYLVKEHNAEALATSFDELHLFGHQTNDIISKFVADPYMVTLDGLSKVTNYVRNVADVILAPPDKFPPVNFTPDMLVLDEFLNVNITNHDELGFEVITKRVLPTRPVVSRCSPLTMQQWSQHMNAEGQIIDVAKLKEIVFRGGLEPNTRIEAWKFFLGFYKWDSNYKTRTEERKKKVDDYFRMKLQWKSVAEAQEKRFASLRDYKSVIDKDVTRTDRVHEFFKGEDNVNISVLYDILMTHCMFNFDLGYVQGMSDLLSPILVVMENEVDAFWCFAGFIDIVVRNFDLNQEGMKKQLCQMNLLVKFLDPELCNYLESHESSNMYFCFRWLLIWFKREFSFPDIMRLWEVLWTRIPCENFHLFVCLAILDAHRNTIIENNFAFTEILKLINDLSGQIDLEETLKVAEGIYLQLKTSSDLPSVISEIIAAPSQSGKKEEIR